MEGLLAWVNGLIIGAASVTQSHTYLIDFLKYFLIIFKYFLKI